MGTSSADSRLRSRVERLLPDRGPTRVLATATLVSTIGKGLYMTVSAIYFTRSVGLSVHEVGLGLTAGAAVGLVVSTPMGYLVDRRGPREMLILFSLLQAAASAALVLVTSFSTLVAMLCLYAVFESGAGCARGAAMAGALPPEGRVRARAYLRAITNIGISVGTVFAGVALAVDTRPWYLAMILGDAASYAAVAAIMVRLPHVPPVPAPATGPRLVAMRDRPYLVFTALSGLLAVNYGILDIAVPLWVTLRTDAPRWLVAVIMLVNTTMVVALQVRMSRGTERVGGASAAHVRAGMLLALACLLFAFSAGRSTWVAVVLLLLAAFVHVFGEMLHAAGSWGLSFELAPTHAQGQYQGAFSMGFGMSKMITPVVVTTMTIGWGAPGWVLLGVMFVLVGVLVPPVARWAARNRPHDVASEPAGTSQSQPVGIAGSA